MPPKHAFLFDLPFRFVLGTGVASFETCRFAYNRAMLTSKEDPLSNGHGGGYGGGLWVRGESSSVSLGKATSFEANVAYEEDGGNSIYIDDADGTPTVEYTLPAPRARWIFSSNQLSQQLQSGAIEVDYPFLCASQP